MKTLNDYAKEQAKRPEAKLISEAAEASEVFTQKELEANSLFTKTVSLTMQQWDKLNILIFENTQVMNEKLNEDIHETTKKMILEELADNKAIKEELLR